ESWVVAERETSTTRLGAWPLAASVVVATLIALLIIEPRFHHSFPSMVDDWSAIKDAPDNARVTLRLGNPEPERYRPGWTLWNAVQWHTFGAPRSFVGPQIWNVLRVLALVAGLVLATEVLSRGRTSKSVPTWLRWLLVTSVPLVLVTVPGFAVDLARY